MTPSSVLHRRHGAHALMKTALAAVLAASTAAVMLICIGAQPASATQMLAVPMPSGPMTIEIHKYEQPDTLGNPASGLEITDPSLLPQTPPVSGATFTATRVPNVDLTTHAGQREAGEMTVDEAAQRIADAAAVPETSDTTDGSGDATLSVTTSGLYYVQETVTPQGFVNAAPFLVALPLTNPETRDGWLTTVHVYPKNERVGIRLSVVDEDSVALGDTVHWKATADLPAKPTTSYVVRQKIDPRLQLVDGVDGFTLGLSCACAPLAEGADYLVTQDQTTKEYVIEFTAAGRAKLATAAAEHPGVTVTVDYDTIVLAEGELQNTATLHVDGSDAANDTAETRWGPLEIIVHERGSFEIRIPGARFQLYLTEADALAGTNPIVIEGVREWTSDADGQIYIRGLRFSDFVNGVNVAADDSLYRNYFVKMTHIPDGYSGVQVPIGLSVTSSTEAQVAVVELWRSVGPGPGPGGLPVTGAQMAGASLLLALALGTSGAALFAARKRRRGEAQ